MESFHRRVRSLAIEGKCDQLLRSTLLNKSASYLSFPCEGVFPPDIFRKINREHLSAGMFGGRIELARCCVSCAITAVVTSRGASEYRFPLGTGNPADGFGGSGSSTDRKSRSPATRAKEADGLLLQEQTQNLSQKTGAKRWPLPAEKSDPENINREVNLPVPALCPDCQIPWEITTPSIRPTSHPSNPRPRNSTSRSETACAVECESRPLMKIKSRTLWAVPIMFWDYRRWQPYSNISGTVIRKSVTC